MKNNAQQNQELNNRNFPEDPNQVIYKDSEGFTAYGENDASSNNNRENTQQEGFTDDSGVGHNTVNPEPNPDETEKKDEDIDYEEDDNDLEKDEDIEEENPDDEDYPEEDENPDEKQKYYLRTNGKNFNVFFDL